MIDTIIKGYHLMNNKSRLKLIESILGEENFFRHEVSFFDDGRVTAGIIRMEEDYKKISTEIEFVKNTSKPSEETEARLNFLYRRQLEFLQTIAFQSSQRLEKIPACLKLLEGLKLDFVLCLEGMQFYIDGDMDKARQKLDEYLSKHKNFGEHYQLNKIYGILNFSSGDFDTAKICLQKVTQICPDDLEVHKFLAKVYKEIGNKKGEEVELKIIELLEV